MGKWSTFPERVESLDLAYTSARKGRGGKPDARAFVPFGSKKVWFLPAAA